MRFFPVLLLLFVMPLSAQQADPGGDSSPDVEHLEETPVFKVDVVSKTAKALNYEHRSGSTKIDFVGTALMPGAKGQAKVESKKGYIEIEVEFKNIGEPWKYGSEYLTYVLWAISPEGRAVNLGEILLKNGRGKINVTTELQVFGLVVTAEPYFATRQPSDLIVLENELRKGTRGQVHIIDAKYELLKRGQYEPLANPLALGLDLKTTPLELYEARNAVQIAKATGAEKYAADAFTKAEASLQQAAGYPLEKRYHKEIARHSRKAVQIAEDARALTVVRQEEERIETERRAQAEAARAAAEREAAAKAAAEEEARRRAVAEAAQKAEEERRAQAEAAKAAADRQRLEAELAAARAEAETARSDAARSQALIAQAEANRRAQDAEHEKRELRRKLLQQFNMVLDTRDSERGLVINMSDVLFDTGKYDLRSVAREKLARVAGIMLSYPGLRLEAEGHTDSTGSMELNQTLSENRADSVRQYLISQGIPTQSISSKGMAYSMPVASNDTASGRQQNRRVELIVSGEVIGTDIATVQGGA